MDFNKLNRGDLNNLQIQDLDFDKEAMWSNLENRKKRRPLLWWRLMASGVGLILLGSLFFYFQNEKSIKSTSQIIDSQPIEKTESKSTILNDNPKNKFENQKIEQSTAKAEKKLKPKSSQKRKAENGFESKIESGINAPFLQNRNFNGSDNFNDPITQSVYEGLKNKTNKVIQYSPENESVKSEKLDLAEAIELKQTFLDIKNNEEFDLPKSVSQKVKANKSLNFLLTPVVGIGAQFQSLDSKIADTDFNYLNTRKANEKQHESWAFGLLIDKMISKKLMIGTGIEFVQHNEQLTLTESQTNNIDAFQQNEVPSDFLGREGFLTRKVSTIYQNQHRLINVPLSVSLLLNSKKVHFAPTASLIFNVSQRLDGHIQNEQGAIEELQPYFKSNIGLAYRFGCRFYYPMNNRFLLFANPQFELNPNDVTKDINPLSQKRNILRLDIGVSTKI